MLGTPGTALVRPLYLLRHGTWQDGAGLLGAG